MSDVILYKEDIDRLNSILQSLVGETRIFSALLINKDTRLLAHQGSLAMFDMSALAALIVGSFASTQAIAGLIGEHEFATMSHTGKTKNLLISLVDDNTIIATVFDKSIHMTAVSASIAKHVGMLQQALDAISRNMETLFQGPLAMPSLSNDDVEQGFNSFFAQPATSATTNLPAPAQSSVPQAEPGNRPNENDRTIPAPPKTQHLEYASARQTDDPMRGTPRSPDLGYARQQPTNASRKIPPPSNTEYLYFTSMNYLKNKAKEGAAFQKHKNEKGILSRLFNRSRQDS